MKEMMGLQRDMMQPAMMQEEIEDEERKKDKKSDQKGGSSANSRNQQWSQEVRTTAANCGTDRPGSTLSYPVDDVQRRSHLEHHPEHQVPVHHLQMEAPTPDDEDQARGGTRDGQGQGHQEALEAQSSMDHWMMHGRHLAALWGHLGSARQLCNSPKTWWLAQTETEPERDPEASERAIRTK